MMFLWISLVPAGMVHSQVAMKSSSQPPESRSSEAFGELEHDHAAFGAEGRLRHLPPLVLDADQIGGGHDHVVEEHLREVCLPGGLANRADVDPRRGHVHQEVRNAAA